MSDIDDLLKTETGDRPFTETDPLELDVEQDVAIEGGYVDEAYVQRLREANRAELRAGEEVLEEVFDSLTGEQKRAVLNSLGGDIRGKHASNHPLYIDEKAVPKELHLHWVGPLGVKNLGWRGYTPVVKSKETLSWVPNCRVFGHGRFIRHATMVLCAEPKREYLLRLAQEAQAMAVTPAEIDERVRSALSAVYRKLGISYENAKRLDQANRSGVITRRGPDPDSPEGHDLVNADNLPQPAGSDVGVGVDRAGTRRRVRGRA